MTPSLRGRPRLDLELEHILKSGPGAGTVVAAARELGCSDAYMHVRFRRAGLTLQQVLDAADLEELLNGPR